MWNIGSVTSENITTNGVPHTRSVSITGNKGQFLILALGTDTDDRDYAFSSATFDGDAMTRIKTELHGSDGPSVDMWYINISGKASGSYNLYYAVSTGTPDKGALAYFTVTGAKSGDVFENYVSENGEVNPSDSITTTTNNALVIDAFCSEQTSNLTVGAGQTSLVQFNWGGRFGMSYKVVSTAGATTMEWTSGTSKDNAYVTAAFNPGRSSGAFILTQL